MTSILHVIPSVAPRYGGPSTAIVAMCDALNGLTGVTAEVMATDSDGPGHFERSRWLSSLTKLHLMPHGDRCHLRQWLDENVSRYDVVHTHSAWNWVVHAARQAALQYEKPLVYRPCGMLSSYSWSRRKLLRYGYWFARERGNVRAAAAFHCTSEGEADEVRRHSAAKGVIHVIPNGVEPAAWKTPVNRDELRRRCGPNAIDRPIILFLSRLHPKKGLTEFLLPAVAKLRTAFLAIVGGPDDHAKGYEDEVRRDITRLGISDRVALLGPISPAERWAMFDGADIFALPSRSENFGIVVAEAMARGCPVLVTNGVQSHEHVSNADAGVVVLPSVEKVAGGLMMLLSLSRNQMGENGRGYAHTHFGWNNIAKQLLHAYRACLSQNHTAPSAGQLS